MEHKIKQKEYDLLDPLRSGLILLGVLAIVTGIIAVAIAHPILSVPLLLGSAVLYRKFIWS